MLLQTLLLVGNLLGCSEQGFVEVPDTNKVGELLLNGRACHPESKTWLSGATVYTHLVTSQGHLFKTVSSVTDDKGYWTLEGLAEDTAYLVYLQYGNEALDMFTVSMDDNDVTLQETTCGGSELHMAVVTGDYDDMEEVFAEAGIGSYTLINGVTGAELVQFLSDVDNLWEYDGLFFPGGHLEEDVFYDTNGSDTQGAVPSVLEAIRAYVEAGGLLFASDWSYDVVERVWPEAIDFLGDDEVAGAAQIGEPALVEAEVTDYGLSESLEELEIDVEFDLDAWPVMESVGSDVVTYLEGDLPYRIGMEQSEVESAPVMVSFEAGDGKVVFLSFRLSANKGGKAIEAFQYLLNDL